MPEIPKNLSWSLPAFSKELISDFTNEQLLVITQTADGQLRERLIAQFTRIPVAFLRFLNLYVKNELLQQADNIITADQIFHEPEVLFGPNIHLVLKFGRHIDSMKDQDVIDVADRFAQKFMRHLINNRGKQEKYFIAALFKMPPRLIGPSGIGKPALQMLTDCFKGLMIEKYLLAIEHQEIEFSDIAGNSTGNAGKFAVLEIMHHHPAKDIIIKSRPDRFLQLFVNPQTASPLSTDQLRQRT